MELNTLTQMELLDLRMKVNEELKNYDNRSKQKVYSIHIPFVGWDDFIDKDVATKQLIDYIEEGTFMFEETDARIQLRYIDHTQVESCVDYNQSKHLIYVHT